MFWEGFAAQSTLIVFLL